MTKIKVPVPREKKKYDIPVKMDMTGADVVALVVYELCLPRIDNDGNRVEYKLVREMHGAEFGGDEKLANHGVIDGEDFRLESSIADSIDFDVFGDATHNLVQASQILDNLVKVVLPAKLQLKLTDSNEVYQLDEYRKDERYWQTVAGASAGGILGVVVNWVTTDPFVITGMSVIAIVLLAIMAVIAGLAARDHGKRAEEKLRKIKEESQPASDTESGDVA